MPIIGDDATMVQILCVFLLFTIIALSISLKGCESDATGSQLTSYLFI